MSIATKGRISRHSSRFASLPHAVEQGVVQLGNNLRAARLRRNMSIEEVADRIGVSRFAVADAEHGKPSTGIAVYAALLWTYRLLDQMTGIASASQDSDGISRIATRARAGTIRSAGLSNDF